MHPGRSRYRWRTLVALTVALIATSAGRPADAGTPTTAIPEASAQLLEEGGPSPAPLAEKHEA